MLSLFLTLSKKIQGCASPLPTWLLLRKTHQVLLGSRSQIAHGRALLGQRWVGRCGVLQGTTEDKQAWRWQSSRQTPPLYLRRRETQELLAHPGQQSAVSRSLGVLVGLSKISPERDLSMPSISASR